MSAVIDEPTHPRILMIEDNPGDIAWLRHALNLQGAPYELVLLADGEMALRFVDEHRTGKHKPDPCVILLDLYLPKYDGLEVLRAIKRAPVLAHIHVVVLCGTASPVEEAEILALGGIYRPKPAVWTHCLELAAEIFAICHGPRPEMAAGKSA